jgi:hypothetical protein
MNARDADFRGSLGLGLVATAVLGPVVVVAFVIMIASGLSAFLGVDAWGWLSTETPLDFLYSFGVGEGSLANYLGFVVGGMIGTLAALTIRHAITGRSSR